MNLKHTEIHYWGHASYSIISAGHHFLIDPVLEEPFEYGDTYFNPPREIDRNKIPAVSAIYISHNHRDHFDENTLKYFSKDNPWIFCPNDSDIFNTLQRIGLNKIKILNPLETVVFGPHTLFITPSMSPFNVFGIVIITKDITIWNQADTSVNFKTIWEIHNKVGKKIDILFCPFQPLKEYCQYWPEETHFPKKRLENLIKKALAVNCRYILPSSCSIKMGGRWEYLNSRCFPVSKYQFIKLLKDQSPLSQVYDIEAGAKISVDDKKILIKSSNFIRRTGERIDFCQKSQLTPTPLDLQVLSEKDWNEIILHLKKLPSWLSKYMKNKIVYYLECIKANNYCVIIEITSKNKTLSFMLYDHLQKIKEVSLPENWDYWFQYSAADLLKKISNPLSFIPFYAYRNSSPSHKKNLESPLSLYGYDEEHTVDGYGEEHFLSYWPFFSNGI